MTGNKGGPALALSLATQIRARYPNAKFVFAVPPGDMANEHRAAATYGFEVFQRLHPYDTRLRPLKVRNAMSRLSRIHRTASEIRRCDALIDLSAISYVGPPAGSERQVLLSPRVQFAKLTRFLSRPFFAWTQSYGPFSTAEIKKLAMSDLARQDVVCCRGIDSAKHVSELLPGSKTKVFPDVAISLPFDTDRGQELLALRDIPLKSGAFVSVCPSAVLYRHGHGEGLDNEHVKNVSDYCRYFAAEGFPVLLLAHSQFPLQSFPAKCDQAVCQLIVQRLQGLKGLHCIDEDLDPISLKSIISNAWIHVGGRYHSVVAALSSGVPAVSISWHHKYRDLMSEYAVSNSVVEFDDAPIDLAKCYLSKTLQQRDAFARELCNPQRRLMSQLTENTNIFVEWLNSRK